MFTTIQEGIVAFQKQMLSHHVSNPLYVPLKATRTSFSDEQSFDLNQAVQDFLNPEEQKKVLLLLGEAGSGKSVFCEELAIQLWKAFQVTAENKQEVKQEIKKDEQNNAKKMAIPLFISLPQLKDPLRRAIEETLEKVGFSPEQIVILKKEYSFVFILDGYDEIYQRENLYDTNRLREWQAKVIISCRSQALYYVSEYEQYFVPIEQEKSQYHLLQRMIVSPFSTEQIDDYLKLYTNLQLQSGTREKELSFGFPLPPGGVIAISPRSLTSEDGSEEKRTENWKVLRSQLEKVPGLKRLITTPFLLRLAVEYLPAIVAGYDNERDIKGEEQQRRITQTKLYDYFVEEWFKRQEEKLKQVNKEMKEYNLNALFWDYCKEIAKVIFKHKRATINLKELNVEGKAEWVSFFNEGAKLVRSACLLKKYGEEEYGFFHETLVEYFVTRAEHDEIVRNRKQLIQTGWEKGYTFFEELHTQKDGYIKSSVERLEAGGPEIEQHYFDVIECSKETERYAIGAANAISILNRAGISFSGKDFKGIRIPHANLANAILDHTQLQGADLTGVNLQGAWLRKANLAGTKLTGIQFGEKPALHLTDKVYACAYSADKQWLAVGCDDKKIYLYEARTQRLVHTFEGHTSYVTSVAFGAGDLLASGSDDNTVRLWDVRLKKGLHTFKGHTSWVRCVAFGAGDLLASGSRDKTVRLWDVKGKKGLHTFEGHTNWVTSVAFGAGDLLASGSWDNTVRLWDVKTKKGLHTFEGHTQWVTSVAFGAGDLLASGSWDKTVRLWDVKAKKELYTFEGHTSWVSSVAFGAGDLLASGSYDKTVRLWDVKVKQWLHTFEGHTNDVHSVAFGAGDLLASGSNDNTVRLWDVKAKKELYTCQGHTESVTSVAFGAGDFLASGSWDNTVRLWDVKAKKELYTCQGHTERVTSVAFGAGDLLASGSRDNTVRLWDVKTKKGLHTFEGHTNWVTSVAFGAGDLLASGSVDNTVRLWDVKAKKELYTCQGHTESVTSVAFGAGDLLASGSVDNTVRLWDVKAKKELYTFEGHTGWVVSVAFGAGGDLLASGSGDNTVRLWDVKAKKELYTFEGHTDWVRSVAFGAGDLLASGSHDKTVRLWDIQRKTCLAVLQGFRGSVYSVAWQQTAEGLFLATGSGDKAVRYWQVLREKDNTLRIVLHWSSRQTVLYAPDVNLSEVTGIDASNYTLLKQHGAIGEPTKIEEVAEAKQEVESLPKISNLQSSFFHQNRKDNKAKNSENKAEEENRGRATSKEETEEEMLQRAIQLSLGR